MLWAFDFSTSIGNQSIENRKIHRVLSQAHSHDYFPSDPGLIYPTGITVFMLSALGSAWSRRRLYCSFYKGCAFGSCFIGLQIRAVPEEVKHCEMKIKKLLKKKRTDRVSLGKLTLCQYAAHTPAQRVSQSFCYTFSFSDIRCALHEQTSQLLFSHYYSVKFFI